MENWLIQWSNLAATAPVLTQILLFRLGYAERTDNGIIGSSPPIWSLLTKKSIAHRLFNSMNFWSAGEVARPRKLHRIAILGANGTGKSSYVFHVSGLRPPGFDAENMEEGGMQEKLSNALIHGACILPYSSSSIEDANTLREGKPLKNPSAEMAVSLTAVPLAHARVWLAKSQPHVDMVVLMFECGNKVSLDTTLDLEKLLPASTPRLFVANKFDLLSVERRVSSGGSEHTGYSAALHPDIAKLHEATHEKIKHHLQQHYLPDVLLTSTLPSHSSGLDATLQTMREILTDPASAVPTKHNKKGKRGIWVSLVPVVSISVVASIGLGTMYMATYQPELWKQAQNRTKDVFSSALRRFKSAF